MQLQRRGEGEVCSRNGRNAPTPHRHRPSHRRYGLPLAESWPNRDPLGEPGFERTRGGSAGSWADVANRYQFVSNQPLTIVDPLGLKLFVCNRTVKGLLYVLTLGNGLHTYFWDDKTGKSCAKTGSSGSDPNLQEQGPSGDACFPVDNSDGKVDLVMDCCSDRANITWWLPWVNDCKHQAGSCLETYGLSMPDGVSRWNSAPQPPQIGPPIININSPPGYWMP